ncbi:hypothetical protein RYX56_14530 [Alkalihalophilus lindianensis]|uniref:YibE/F-like protein n=1 Tax=Alkalihalophilus lindianensis TaxID=1630542 RepID=A0ABU3XCG3_9BACI|nr:hypothetical protein [Alkalihalophilus lindianensis]MDV2685579.1 hypothetical protein [Alkalihalophilus lindianensis]
MVGRLTSYIIGIVLVGVGINLLIIANVGLDPWGLFNIAISTSLGITLGSFYIYSGIFFVIINSIIQRKIPDILGMVTSFFMGVSIDISNLFMSGLSTYSSWV